ncbi:MAG: hypothetical protein ACOYER_06010 [Limnochordia bacterium]|jgi:hypothetical protein
MKIPELMAQLGENREEVLQQAVQCETVDELLQLAEGNSIKLTEQEADELLRILHPQLGELSDSELDGVTGGSDKEEGEKKSGHFPVLW